jgi:hypothetical protein
MKKIKNTKTWNEEENGKGDGSNEKGSRNRYGGLRTPSDQPRGGKESLDISLSRNVSSNRDPIGRMDLLQG